MIERKQDNINLSPVKQALLKVREMRAKLDEFQFRRSEPIAITGVGLRFPGGCRDLDSFWNLLKNGVDAIGEVPKSRWDLDEYYDLDPDAPGKMYARHGGFLDDIDLFDASFFGISPREAQSIDPQQRLLLEVGWEALENAGDGIERLSESSTGVYLAINNSDYFRHILSEPDRVDAYATVGNASSIAASRLSYLLNLKGPAIAVDTACSSSLVAIHLAIQSLRSGECDMAMAGGVNLMLLPEFTINFCKSRMLSPEGRCKSFDTSADGYVRGEGCAMIVLKRLSDAKRDGNPILSVILGSAVNQDGRSGGITAPNGPSQEAVILRAMADAGVKPNQLGYVEAHGTATPLGDPIEAHALGAVFGRHKNNEHRLVVGSVKTNIGHLEAVAGLAGLIKAALVLKNGVLPANLHFEKANDLINLDELGLTIPTDTVPWQEVEAKRIAGVSSFGLCGTNAHVILAQSEESGPQEKEVDITPQLLALSAKSHPALVQLTDGYRMYLSREQSDNIANVCCTASISRSHFDHRLAVITDSKRHAVRQLSAFTTERPMEGTHYGILAEDESPDRIAFLFTGQGSQYPGMGRALYDTEPEFRKSLEACQEMLQSHFEKPLISVLYPEPGDEPLLNQPIYTQTGLFALEYALVRLWRSWGIRPAIVLGHSLGEYAAACAAGIFSVEDGLNLVVQRARLIASLKERGEMVAVLADPGLVEEAVESFHGRVCIAALNNPQNTVVSGAAEAVRQIVKNFEARGIACRSLNVTQAFHSPLLDPMLDQFEEFAGQIRFKPAQIGFISNVSGRQLQAKDLLDAHYWRRHLREPVRFSDSIVELAQSGVRTCVEIGPHPVLSTMGRLIDMAKSFNWLPSLQRNTEDRARILESLAGLYVQGATIDWEGFHQHRPYRKTDLPNYPFQRERYWMPQPGQPTKTVHAKSGARWEAAVKAGRKQSRQGPFGLRPETYASKWDRLELLTNAMTLTALMDLGGFKQTDESVTVDEILETCAIRPVYRDLVSRWLVRLAQAGALKIDNGRFANPDSSIKWTLTQHLEHVREDFSDQPQFMAYVERCGKMLTDVLTGRKPALETLFPEGSPDFAEWLYSEFSISYYISQIAAFAISAWANVQNDDKTLRILEIGAGTGGTTGAVLENLPQKNTEYWFTDVSKFFFDRATERFADFSSMLRFKVLDIEQPPGELDLAKNGFHVVLATNVLHATRNLDKTLDHIHQMLASGGMLVLCEVTQELAWYDITTGLIEGWQNFEDHWRTDSPILAAEKWQEILLNHGFETVAILPEKGSVAEALGQHVILARAPFREQSSDTPLDNVTESFVDGTGAEKTSLGNEKLSNRHLSEEAQKVLDSPDDERRKNLLGFVLMQVAQVLKMESRQRPEEKNRLMDLGMDSLMAVELRNRLAKTLALQDRLPVSLIYDYPTPASIASVLEQELIAIGHWKNIDEPPAEDVSASTGTSIEEIAELSDEQVELMLMERLQNREKED